MPRKRKIGLCVTVSVFLILSFFFLTSDVFTVKPNQAAIEKNLREKAEVAAIDHTRPTTFRNTYWGMTTAQVKAVEEWPFADVPQSDDFLIYDGTLFGAPCSLVYVLRAKTPNPTLDSAFYTFEESEGISPATLRLIYAETDKYLTLIYGPAVDFKKNEDRTLITITWKRTKKTWRSKNTEVSLCYKLTETLLEHSPWIKTSEDVSIHYEAMDPQFRAQN